MGDDDLILAMQTSVKKEVVEHYLGERRIIQEEMQLVFEAACAFHGGLQNWEAQLDRLAGALLEEPGAREFFELAGLSPPDAIPDMAGAFEPPRALTARKRYLRLAEGLYQRIWDQHLELVQERERVLGLLAEVNRDIAVFEADYDLLAISAYLRSLDQSLLMKRRIMGYNFSSSELALSAEALSFRPISPARLEQGQPPGTNPHEKTLPNARGLLKRIFARNKKKAARLWK